MFLLIELSCLNGNILNIMNDKQCKYLSISYDIPIFLSLSEKFDCGLHFVQFVRIGQFVHKVFYFSILFRSI